MKKSARTASTSGAARQELREAVEAFRDHVAALPETLAVFVVSGGDDFIIQVAVRDTGHLRDFVLDHVSRHRNIADVRTSLVYDHIRKTSVEVLPPGRPSPPRTRPRPASPPA
ncbi:Lrp/AsnC ligand binding domain-containing protein [Streptosporangium sp. DT93]|uniref:Lrp/AsnC ligand binding domain-containing protein n=1 Tax=Streptosporangium sp. DT93 TaxID=3393428 RepID=UPI003CE7B2A6